MARTFKHMTYEQRKQIKEMLDNKVPVQRIAEAIGVSRGTVYREIEKGTIDGTYNPDIAEEQRQEALRIKGREPILSVNPELAQVIADYILIEHLSPGQISNIIKDRKDIAGNCSITHNTIYNAIDKGLLPNVSRDSLRPEKTTVYNNGNIFLAKWVREELDIKDGDVLRFEVTDDKKIIFYK